jgi:hypothetical protein
LLLAYLSFFEYCILVQTKNIYNTISADIEFDSEYPKSATYIQQLACQKFQISTVTFNSQLSQFQPEEDSIQGSYPRTTAIEIDLAEVLLRLFVPWNRLPSLFQLYALLYKTKQDACTQIWNIVEPILSQYNQAFAKNIDLLQKSKEDCQVDTVLCKINNIFDNSFDYKVNFIQSTSLDLSNKESCTWINKEPDAEILIAVYYSVANSWYSESLITRQYIPVLSSRIKQP